MSSERISASKARSHSASSWVAFWDVLRRRSCAAQLDGVWASGGVVDDQDLCTFHTKRCRREDHTDFAARFRSKLPGIGRTTILDCLNAELAGGRPVDPDLRIDV